MIFVITKLLFVKAPALFVYNLFVYGFFVYRIIRAAGSILSPVVFKAEIILDFIRQGADHDVVHLL